MTRFHCLPRRKRYVLSFCVAILLAATPAHGQEPSSTPPQAPAVAPGDSVRADSIRHPVPGLPAIPELPEVFRRPPPDMRAPWPLGPKNRYAHTATLVGAGVGALYAWSQGEHPIPGAVFTGLFGYIIGMMFD
jgi:hypothetical protein